MQNAHGGPTAARGPRRRVRPVRGPAQRARRPAVPAQRRRASPTWRRCASATLDQLDERRPVADAGDLLADGFVYEMVLRHEMQHTETMLQTLQLMTSERYGPPGRGRCRRAGRRPRRMVAVPGGPFEMGAPDARLRLRQRAPAARGRRRRVPDRPCARQQRRSSPSSSLDGGYERPRALVGRGLALAAARGRRRAAVLVARRRQSLCARSATSSRWTRRCRCATCRGTRPTPTRAGPGSGCRPRRSGRRRRVGRSGADCRRIERTSTSSRSAARRRRLSGGRALRRRR